MPSRPAIFGDGEQSRDFTYIDNAVVANLSAYEALGNICRSHVQPLVRMRVLASTRIFEYCRILSGTAVACNLRRSATWGTWSI